jgi:hypothetical protein
VFSGFAAFDAIASGYLRFFWHLEEFENSRHQWREKRSTGEKCEVMELGKRMHLKRRGF